MPHHTAVILLKHPINVNDVYELVRFQRTSPSERGWRSSRGDAIDAQVPKHWKSRRMEDLGGESTSNGVISYSELRLIIKRKRSKTLN